MKRILILIAVVLSLTITKVSAIENNVYNCPMGRAAYGLGSYGISSMILSWTVSILLVILLLAGIYWFIKSANKK